MKKKILTIAGGLVLLALVLVNISLAFNLDGSSGFSLSTLKMQIASAQETTITIIYPIPTTKWALSDVVMTCEVTTDNTNNSNGGVNASIGAGGVSLGGNFGTGTSSGSGTKSTYNCTGKSCNVVTIGQDSCTPINCCLGS